MDLKLLDSPTHIMGVSTLNVVVHLIIVDQLHGNHIVNAKGSIRNLFHVGGMLLRPLFDKKHQVLSYHPHLC